MKQTSDFRCVLTLLAAVLLNVPVLSFAQQKVAVKGTVIDETFRLVSGTTVQLKGSGLTIVKSVNGMLPDMTFLKLAGLTAIVFLLIPDDRRYQM